MILAAVPMKEKKKTQQFQTLKNYGIMLLIVSGQEFFLKNDTFYF
jgi:hypothetical protein